MRDVVSITCDGKVRAVRQNQSEQFLDEPVDAREMLVRERGRLGFGRGQG
jgi:hypothetical protein